MLLRFRIRNLQSSPEQTYTCPASVNKDLLISIGSDVYDELITYCPPAALKYVDDEDGETVRVGSSAELIDKLHWTNRPSASCLQSSISPFQTFDVEPRLDILAAWSWYSAEHHDHWREFTKLPVMVTSNQQSLLPELNRTRGGDNDKSSFDSSPDSNLTGEGRRQAQAAGDRLRAWSLQHHLPSPSPTGSRNAAYQNRWASYSQTPASFVPSVTNQNTKAYESSSAGKTLGVCSEPPNAQLHKYLKPGYGEAVDRTGDLTNLVKRTKTRASVVNSRRTSYTRDYPLKLETHVDDPQSTGSPRTEPVQDSQSSLIEVFNNELKRLAVAGSSRTDHSPIHSLSEPLSRSHVASGMIDDCGLRREKEEKLPSATDMMRDLCFKLQRLDQRCDGGISQLHTIQHGIDAALRGFCAAISEVADSVHDELNTKSPRNVDQHKTDKTLLNKASENLCEIASATIVLQTQILPVLQSYVAKPLRQAFEPPATSLQTGERNNCSAFKQLNTKGQAPNTPFTRQTNLIDEMPNALKTGQDPRPLDSSSNTEPLIHNSFSLFSSAVHTDSAPPKASRVDETCPSIFAQNITPFSFDDSATHMAERRFPTMERFEQERSSGIPVSQKNSPNQRRTISSNCQEFISTNTRSDETINDATRTGSRERRPYTFRPTNFCESRAPANIIESLSAPRMGNDHEHEMSPITNAGHHQTLQSPGMTTLGRNDIPPVEHIRATRWPYGLRPNASGSTVEVQAQQCLRQGSDIADDFTDHGDPATVAKVQACVEELDKLGFSCTVEGGLNRLVVYAQASGGDLIEAIDLISEESQAYEDALSHTSQEGFLV
ncbi:MAG: hypothetical protein Q9215_006670 [Flavoplaca cf. flavocitrina]